VGLASAQFVGDGDKAGYSRRLQACRAYRFCTVALMILGAGYLWNLNEALFLKASFLTIAFFVFWKLAEIDFSRKLRSQGS
jgi:hypothetical protein